MPERLLEVTELEVGYGAIRALENVSFTVETGEIVTLIGANGAGKTTLLRTLSGLLVPRSGRIRLAGEELCGLAPEAIVQRGVIHVPEGRGIFPELTVRENLDLGAYLRRDTAEIQLDLERILAMFPHLARRLDQPGGTISGGEQQMLAIARGLLARPKLLLLDEPSMGLSPILVQEIFELLGRINRDGVTVLLVEQNAHLALKASHRASVLENGRLVLAGPSAELLRDPRIREAYLG